jgi:hypothetical protein
MRLINSRDFNLGVVEVLRAHGLTRALHLIFLLNTKIHNYPAYFSLKDNVPLFILKLWLHEVSKQMLNSIT